LLNGGGHGDNERLKVPSNPAVAGNITVKVLAVVAGMVALADPVMSMSVTIDVQTDRLVIRCKPFNAATLSLSRILAVQTLEKGPTGNRRAARR
jgi:hypothetical protein